MSYFCLRLPINSADKDPKPSNALHHALTQTKNLHLNVTEG